MLYEVITNTVGFHTETMTNIAAWQDQMELSVIDEMRRQNASDGEKLAMGRSLFRIHCASCHGESADGMQGKAQDLRARLSKESVLYTIRHGAVNFSSHYPSGMPGGLVGEADANHVITSYSIHYTKLYEHRT